MDSKTAELIGLRRAALEAAAATVQQVGIHSSWLVLLVRHCSHVAMAELAAVPLDSQCKT